MEWLKELFTVTTSAASSVVVLGCAAAAGLALGSIKVRGIQLGIAGVLFAGLIFGHFGLKLDHEVLGFVREFGLILFVYSVGLQVGPGFITALRAEGLRLNLLAGSIVLFGVVLTVAFTLSGLVEAPTAVGIFGGATTNTPSLAAAGQALQENPPSVASALRALKQISPEKLAGYPDPSNIGEEQKRTLFAEVAKMPGLGYAVAYPFGVIGIILVMLFVRFIFRIDPAQHAEALRQLQKRGSAGLVKLNLRVTNPNLVGVQIGEIPAVEKLHLVISRVQHEDRVQVADPMIALNLGDILLAVGKPVDLDELRMIVGEPADVDISKTTSEIIARRLIVTQRSVIGKTADELEFLERYGVQITRIRRAEVELPPTSDVRLQFADQVQAVGAKEAIDRVAAEIGNSPRSLDHPDVIPLFVGIVLGVIVGSWPIQIPGLPAPVKLGLAGGPLLIAILMSQIGKIGPLVSYVPASANFMLREVGIVLFLACVGISSGDRFMETITHGNGLWWMFLGAIVTFVPLASAALISQLFMKMNFVTMVGVLAGSMTDPPALSFANQMTQSEGASVSYATVYPLTMILRVLSAQLMIIFLVS